MIQFSIVTLASLASLPIFPNCSDIPDFLCSPWLFVWPDFLLLCRFCTNLSLTLANRRGNNIWVSNLDSKIVSCFGELRLFRSHLFFVCSAIRIRVKPIAFSFHCWNFHLMRVIATPCPRVLSTQREPFPHPQQGRIDFNTVNPSLLTGMDFLIPPCR